MNCRDLEERLEAFLAGALAPTERNSCGQHLKTCASCRELLELAQLGEAVAGVGAESGPDLVPAVLALTSSGACGRAQDLLSESLDGSLEHTDQQLLRGHLAACSDCRALSGVLLQLARELPRMAVVRPDRRFVEDVLRRTLPVEVQMRRWWARVWPQLVRRPRFASETAFLGIVVLVLIFATPGSPLGAVPSRALAIAHDPSLPQIDLPALDLGSRLEATARALRESQGARVAAEWGEKGREAADGAARLVTGARARVGTFWDEAASLLESGDVESTSEPETLEESS